MSDDDPESNNELGDNVKMADDGDGREKHEKKKQEPKQRKAKKVSKSQAKEHARKDALKEALATFYAEMYGQERWLRLMPALLAPTRYSCLVNKYAVREDAARALAPVTARWQRMDCFSSLDCFELPFDVYLGEGIVSSASPPTLSNSLKKNEMPFPPPVSDFESIKTHYLLDAASVLATDALAVRPDDRVLDICAAPGGKSLCIFQRLGPHGELHANEMSQERRKRLQKVLREYTPRRVFESQITITGHDGTRRDSFLEDYFDRVLVDAPCSSERHLLHDEEELAKWTSARTKNLSKRQVLLLLEAIRAAKSDGGRVVYATCSLSRFENDAVIEKALRKSKHICLIKTFDRTYPFGEATKCGWIVLPDLPGGWGPLYFSVLEKGPLKKQFHESISDDGGLSEDAEDD